MVPAMQESFSDALTAILIVKKKGKKQQDFELLLDEDFASCCCRKEEEACDRRSFCTALPLPGASLCFGDSLVPSAKSRN